MSVVHVRDFRVYRDFVPGDLHLSRYWYRLPDDVVYIGRGTPWGNPFRMTDPDPPWCGHLALNAVGEFVPQPLGRAGAVYHFRLYAVDRLLREPTWLDPLRGKRLACWCAPEACHGDMIVELLREM